MKKNPEKIAVFITLQQYGHYISLPNLLKLLDFYVAERTVRRWLKEMVNDHKVSRIGQKRGVRYKAIGGEINKQMTFNEKSREAIHQVRQPLFERSLVTYNPKWLESYLPNETSYLSEEIKRQLQAAGDKSKIGLPAGTYARHIYNRLLIDLSYNSSRLEGNTYSLLDTQRLILEGASAEGKLDEEKIMILNHKEAIAYLINHAQQIEVNFNTVCTLQYLLADGLVPAQYAGKVRDYGVRISGSAYVPWENPEKLKKQLNMICQKAALIHNPYEKSLFLLAHIAYLQAFSDVNKRTSRLSANIPLIQQNLVPLSFNDVNKEDYTCAMISIYELNDCHALIDLYVHSYLRTCQLYAVTLDIVSYDEVRVRYRQQRREVIRYILTNEIIHEAIDFYIEEQAKKYVDEKDQLNFIKDVKEDLREINPARLAGLGVTMAQLQAWLEKNK